MTISIASDHAGVELKRQIADFLRQLGTTCVDLGPQSTDSVDYPDYALKVAQSIVDGKARLGILICGTGIGMSISANKVDGIRAALCHREFESRMARSHNDANVLCLGQRVTGSGLALEIVRVFWSTEFEGGRHASRVEKIRSLEK